MSVLEESGLRLAAAVAVGTLCIAAAWRERAEPEIRRAWLIFAGTMVLLAFGHALHTGRAAAESGREAFRLEGLYESRRAFQATVIAIFALAAVVGTLRLFGWLREPWRRHLMAPALSLWLLLAFIAVRTVSHHDIDALLYTHHPLGAHPGTLIELGGIVLLGVLVVRANASSRREVTLHPVYRMPEPGALSNPPAGRFRPQRDAQASPFSDTH